MKAAIYNPYLDTLGGGERYTMAVVGVLLKKGYRVDVQWGNMDIIKKLEERFGINLKEVNVVKDIKRGDSYDVCFWVSDGSVPALKARTNFIHFQVPFTDVNGRSLLNRMKLFRVKKIICNSYFTKNFIDKEYGVDSTVIYPPVAVTTIKPKRKENIILSVGRFSQLTQAKRQDVLVSVFKKMVKKGLQNWKLILAGGIEVGADEYLVALKRQALGYPIEIMESPSYKTLLELYGKAKIYWSASGYGIDDVSDPKKVEHFGIAVVEAMAAGVAPLVVGKGGHKEIIINGKNGYLWLKKQELMAKTQELIKNPKFWKSILSEAQKDSQKYDYARFYSEIESIL